MQDSKREELKKMVNEYQGNCYWEAEGWGDNVPSEEDLEKELESILDYFDSEISKAREEGFREGVNDTTNTLQEALDYTTYEINNEVVVIGHMLEELWNILPQRLRVLRVNLLKTKEDEKR